MKDKPNNVIVFPKANIKQEKEKQTVEDIQHNLDMMKQYHIQEAILNIAPIIFNQLDVAGFGISEDEKDEDIKDCAFIIESIKSLMLKYYGIYHPFHTIIENIFEEKLSDEGSYKIVDRLNVELKEPEQTE